MSGKKASGSPHGITMQSDCHQLNVPVLVVCSSPPPPSNTRGNSAHDESNLLTYRSPYILSTICPALQTNCCISCRSGWSQMISQVKNQWSVIVRPVDGSCQSLWNNNGSAFIVVKWTFISWTAAPVDIPAKCMKPLNLWLFVVW